MGDQEFKPDINPSEVKSDTSNTENKSSTLPPEVQERRTRIADYVDQRLSLTGADGKPLDRDTSESIIRSARDEAMNLLKQEIAARTEGMPDDAYRLEAAYALIGRANDLSYRAAHEGNDTTEALLRGLFQENVSTKRLEPLLNMPVPDTSTPDIEGPSHADQLRERLMQISQPSPERDALGQKLNSTDEYRAKQAAAPDTSANQYNLGAQGLGQEAVKDDATSQTPLPQDPTSSQ